MIKLSASLERRLKEIFPRSRERDQFVTELVEKALELHTEKESPHYVGGTLHLFTDGGARGNPGRAAIGCVLIDPQTGAVLQEFAEAIGTTTNNIAEYEALIAGLKIAKDYRPNHLVCHLDSELVVKQLKGEYRVKMQTFVPLIDQINTLVKEFPTVTFTAVPREQNRHADRLLNAALDALE
jgi:ribonuclease HI